MTSLENGINTSEVSFNAYSEVSKYAITVYIRKK